MPEPAHAVTPSLSAEHLECVRNDAVIFRGVGLSVSGGEALQLAGPNGSGKTSLLRILCGLSAPESGSVRWCGTEIRELGVGLYRHMQYLGHSDAIKLDLTATENLRFARTLGETASTLPVESALTRVGLKSLAGVPARRLSAGQRRRLALARLLLMNASLWLLDEPFTSLDSAGREMVNELIGQHLDAGGLAIAASHEPLCPGDARVRSLSL